MSVGRVKWYDKSKGYGFIESPEGDVFFHFSDILMDGFKALAEDQRVSYECVHSEHGLKAMQIRPLDNRASVRHAARYRTVIFMRIAKGCEADFDKFYTTIPAWFDSMEQDMGLRRIGTWRQDREAVHLIESDRPYEQSLELARDQQCWEAFQKWQTELRDVLDGEPVIMTPIQVPSDEADEEKESSD